MNQHFYIMNASFLFDEKATDIHGVIEQWGDDDQTIIVARRQNGGTFSKIFISGSACPSDYGVKAGDVALYTQDTGCGYRNQEKELFIENVIRVKAGVIKTTVNDMGFNEKRRCWVMK